MVVARPYWENRRIGIQEVTLWLDGNEQCHCRQMKGNRENIHSGEDLERRGVGLRKHCKLSLLEQRERFFNTDIGSEGHAGLVTTGLKVAVPWVANHFLEYLHSYTKSGSMMLRHCPDPHEIWISWRFGLVSHEELEKRRDERAANLLRLLSAITHST